MKDDLVKIIPKSKPETPKAITLFLWVSLLLLVFFLGAYIFLKIEKNSLSAEIKAVENEFIAAGPDKELEKDLKNTAKKINDFSRILGEHKNISGLFNFLRDYCHPKAAWSELFASIPEMKVSLEGETLNFKTLGEQLLAFSKAEGVKEIEVDGVSLTREGKVEFGLSFNFPQRFIKK